MWKKKKSAKKEIGRIRKETCDLVCLFVEEKTTLRILSQCLTASIRRAAVLQSAGSPALVPLLTASLTQVTAPLCEYSVP